MSTVSNSTCTKCQNCGKFTNYAGDPHQKARVVALARIPELERALRLARDMIATNNSRLPHTLEVINDALTSPREIDMTAEDASKMFPIGEKVKYFPILGEDRYEETVVRSEAWALGHGELVLKVRGRAGGVAVSHLEYL